MSLIVFRAQKHASCALWGLTSEPLFCKAVTEAAAIAPLVLLLKSKSEAQGYAAAALCNLAGDPSAARLISEDGAIEPLIAISHGPENWLRKQAVGILQLLNVEVPQPDRTFAIKIPVQKSYFQTLEAQVREVT